MEIFTVLGLIKQLYNTFLFEKNKKGEKSAVPSNNNNEKEKYNERVQYYFNCTYCNVIVVCFLFGVFLSLFVSSNFK